MTLEGRRPGLGRFDALALAAVLVARRAPAPAGHRRTRPRSTPTRATTCSRSRAFTREGVVPLLGPKTSVGEFHHGAFYYFLLAPAAAISDDDPGRGHRLARPHRDRRGRAHVVARPLDRRPARRAPRGAASSPCPRRRSRNRPSSGTRTRSPCSPRSRSPRRGEGARPAAPAGGPLAVGAAGAVVQLHVLGLVFLIAIFASRCWSCAATAAAWRGILGGLGIVALLFTPLVDPRADHGLPRDAPVLDYFASGGAQSRRSRLGAPVHAAPDRRLADRRARDRRAARQPHWCSRR